MAITTKRITMRQGNEADWKPEKMLSAEMAVIKDKKELHFAYADGKTKRVATEDDISKLSGQKIDEAEINALIEKYVTDNNINGVTNEEIEAFVKQYIDANVSDDTISVAVTEWLNAHPEATTTVQDGSITLSKLASDVQEKIENAGAIRPLKIVNMGELFEQPETYLAWFQGTMKYDEEIGCPVAVISGKDAHATGSGKCYFFKIEPKTGEVTLTVAGEYDEADTYGCFSQSFFIDNNGHYVFYASMNEPSGWSEIEKRKYISTDKGKTWTYSVLPGDTVHPIGSIIKLKNGRLIGLCSNGSNVRGQAIYSDNNGETWTKGYVFSNSTEVEIIEMKDCLIAIGRKNLTYTEPLPAVLYFSYDNGATWTNGVESTTITDMCNPCSGVYWTDTDLLELFYCSRASKDGNNGTIYHAYAKLEDAKNDNFKVEIIGESKQESVGIDFGYCATACDQKEKAWVIYYDHADSGNGVNLNLILADKTCVSLPVSDNVSSLLALYSSKKIDTKISSLRSELLSKINEIILENGGEIEDAIDGSMYITDGLIDTWDFTDGSSYDVTTGKFKSKVNNNSFTVGAAYNTLDTPAQITDFSYGVINHKLLEIGDLLNANPNFSLELNFHATSSFTKNTSIVGFMNSKSIYGGVNELKGASFSYKYEDGSDSPKSSSFWTDGYVIDKTGFTSVVIVFSSSGIEIYKNGVLKSSVTIDSLTAYVLQKYLIILDIASLLSFRMYGKALSADEVANNHTYELNKYNADRKSVV